VRLHEKFFAWWAWAIPDKDRCFPQWDAAQSQAQQDEKKGQQDEVVVGCGRTDRTQLYQSKNAEVKVRPTAWKRRVDMVG